MMATTSPNSRTSISGTVPNATVVRNIVAAWIKPQYGEIELGLPEWDDRINHWRVALVPANNTHDAIGEVRVSPAGEVTFATNLEMAAQRNQNASDNNPSHPARQKLKNSIALAPIPSTLAHGDAKEVLPQYPPDTAQLVFTSPPYFNAKPEYHESYSYDDYLNLLKEVFEKCHAVLSEGRFLVVNTSPVLVRRTSRSASSKRLPITFDLHGILKHIGFEFIDDIIWEKPEGAGWHLGRGRRFAADRQPLQYKPVTVTENVTVYRKQTDKLIDWNIRHHPNREDVKASRIADGYERTNIWRIAPAHHKKHPAVFPAALAERVIRYYSFRGDLVLDPFAGIGTVGKVAHELGRRFLLIEKSLNYFEIQQTDNTIMASQPEIFATAS